MWEITIWDSVTSSSILLKVDAFPPSFFKKMISAIWMHRNNQGSQECISQIDLKSRPTRCEIRRGDDKTSFPMATCRHRDQRYPKSPLWPEFWKTTVSVSLLYVCLQLSGNMCVLLLPGTAEPLPLLENNISSIWLILWQFLKPSLQYSKIFIHRVPFLYSKMVIYLYSVDQSIWKAASWWFNLKLCTVLKQEVLCWMTRNTFDVTDVMFPSCGLDMCVWMGLRMKHYS